MFAAHQPPDYCFTSDALSLFRYDQIFTQIRTASGRINNFVTQGAHHVGGKLLKCILPA
jgi:hypothetical protein